MVAFQNIKRVNFWLGPLTQHASAKQYTIVRQNVSEHITLSRPGDLSSVSTTNIQKKNDDVIMMVIFVYIPSNQSYAIYTVYLIEYDNWIIFSFFSMT